MQIFTGDHLFEMSNLFYGKSKKNVINLSSAELAQRVTKVQLDQVLVYINLNFVELLISNSLYQETISILLFIYLFIFYIILYVYKWLRCTISIDWLLLFYFNSLLRMHFAVT